MAKRPAGVTLVAVVVWISGLIQVIGGALLLIALATSNSTMIDTDRGWLTTYAIIGIVIGIVILAVGRGLLRGSSLARIVITIALLLSIVGAVYTVIAVPSGILGTAISAFVSLVALILLHTGRASNFFRR